MEKPTVSTKDKSKGDPQAIRDAATIVLIRRDGETPRVLMGQRGKAAVFMPSKFVFPGGGVDRDDYGLVTQHHLSESARHALAHRADPDMGPVLALGAIRELWEEAGLALAHCGTPPGHIPDAWRTFFAAGHVPAVDALSFIFRAITPPGRPRRFDARFFMAEADRLRGDPDDFSKASDELSHLNWISLPEAQALDLPFITRVVLSEIETRLAEPGIMRPIPFFYHEGGNSFIDALGGQGAVPA